jgi:hypothetical protein
MDSCGVWKDSYAGMPSGLKQAAEKLVLAAESQPQAKARPILKGLAARLKSCPSQNLFEAEFFRSL